MKQNQSQVKQKYPRHLFSNFSPLPPSEVKTAPHLGDVVAAVILGRNDKPLTRLWPGLMSRSMDRENHI